MAALDGNAFRGKYHEELQQTAKAIASAGKGGFPMQTSLLEGSAVALCFESMASVRSCDAT